MEAQPQSGSPSAAYPRWVMLEQYLEIIKVQDSSCSTTDGDDAKTLAAARTSAGHPIQVSLRLAEPPALSRVFLRIPDGLEEEKSKVLAAHGDSLLIQVRIREKNQGDDTFEHFVYNAGAHAVEPPRPPSLWLLPPYYQQSYSYLPGSNIVTRELFDCCTGLLLRGEDELVVAELTGPSLSKDKPGLAELFMFRSGEWKYYHIEISEDWYIHLLLSHNVVPVDDRLLCWVDLRLGVMVLDVFKETPTVQYVELPMDPHDCGNKLNRNVCTTAGGGALKFVNIFGRCCCGAAASCDCEHSRHAYTINTWTMRIGNGDMEWVKDGMVDATELWALEAYKDLPRNPLDRPIVSIDEPEVICFRMRDTKGDPYSRPIWQILVNMRSKTIHSVSGHEEDIGYCYTDEEDLGYCYTGDRLIPSKVSYFFNTYPSSGRRDDATLTGHSQIDIETSPSVLIDERRIGDGHASNQTMQASEIIEALQEIPSYGLGPDELKAYRIISNENGRRLRSFLRLPKNIRKNWLLMEIKASQG